MQVMAGSNRRIGAGALLALAGLVGALSLAFAGDAGARPTSADKDGRPNILVVMTDDMSAAADLKLMPNVQKLIAKKGTTFDDAVDSFPLCCPRPGDLLTGQYAHNHGVKGNFAPLRLVRDEGPQEHPPGLAPGRRLPGPR